MMDSTDDSVDVSVEVSKELAMDMSMDMSMGGAYGRFHRSFRERFHGDLRGNSTEAFTERWLTTYLPGRWTPMDAFVGMFVDPSTETSADFYGKFIGRVRGISTEVHGGPSSSVEVHGNARGRPWERPWKISQKPNSADVCENATLKAI